MDGEVLALFILEVMQQPIMVFISMIVAFLIFIVALRMAVKNIRIN